MKSGSKSVGGASKKGGLLVSEKHYRRLLMLSVLSVSLVAIVPLVIMTATNYYQYQDAFHTESLRPITRLTTNAKLSLEGFFSERVSALSLVVQTETIEDLRDSKKLKQLLTKMKLSFGGFIDLGVIDDTGTQVSYAGPYELQGKKYKEQDWFHEVELRGVHVSEVFLGHRHLPHFVIAVGFHTDMAANYVLRATIDTERIVHQIQALSTHSSNDAFLVNKGGVLQTPSRFYGKVLEPFSIPVPPKSNRAEILETHDENGNALIIGYASIARSPFVLMLLRRPGSSQPGWLSLRRDLAVFLTISIILIISVVFVGSRYMVNQNRQADFRRAAVYHKMEHTNKLAAIGRLAAGVAHEINNPLAIINQKAGLHKDLLCFSEALPPKEKMVELVEAVLESVERCGAITHRLLGFAKHMDIQREGIDLEILIKGVLGFLEREASYRNLEISFHNEKDVPTIESDRGQLQQVFLNIINNAFAAVDDEGQIDISISRLDSDSVQISIEDNGVGIPDEDLEHIFEPFFTTKEDNGTGLGLSVTYGIVQKLGGQTKVTSKQGEGTCFSIILPIK
ncbi:MAG: two-component sensor histidine kinase [Proteobacteria bacterium]|nr:two-component sensor histidine kinase [Pseudomonadota bacterium]